MDDLPVRGDEPPGGTAALPPVTRTLLETARRRGRHPAIIELTPLGPAPGSGAGHAPGPSALGYSELATVITTAARGLARRGARPGDVVAVLAERGMDELIAVHTALAAGCCAQPLDPAAPLRRTAAALTRSDARLLLTGRGAADTALAAAESSRVRQVVAFGEVPATTPFRDLLLGGPAPAAGGAAPVRAVLDHPRAELSHDDLAERLAKLAVSAPVEASDVLLATRTGLAFTLLTTLALSRGATVVSARGHVPAQLAGAVRRFGVTAADHPETAARSRFGAVRLCDPEPPIDEPQAP
ncbi:AMP-binding protein [Allonocardiopsis opalescens]|uniref:AMP-binding enzyme n=1 Tax=Allonocardiopsis opalescens TaxID=1144618 RepID=A0A2T0QE33_9ACTN|nr:AMP-binding protein [Allonocardiopsis opalescens]PRY02152.1 AMP-binding enzyme [Allonocardiopsis opalescens]